MRPEQRYGGARRMLVVLLGVVLCAGLVGCVRLPEEGGVIPAEAQRDDLQPGPAAIQAAGPQPGETPPEIVRHFLDAMTAWPLTTTVAREFLSRNARATWNPQRRTYTYGDFSSPRGVHTVSVDLQDAHHLDGSGRWRGDLPRRDAELRLPIVLEGKEWRIDWAPNALIVPADWFQQRFRQVSLYFFDPTGQVLVPEPVFVPRGDQLATAMVRSLVRGPGPSMAGIGRSFIPEEMSPGLVPVNNNGIADVELEGPSGALAPATVDLMVAQLAWTLRQDPSIRRFRILVGGQPVSFTDGQTDVDVTSGSQYDPAVPVDSDLYGLRDGHLVNLTSTGTAVRTSGLLGTDLELDDVAVSLDGRRAAGVADGAVYTADVEGRAAEPQVVMDSAQQLLRPAWDFDDRVWLVDRTREGAEVSYVVGRKRRILEIPGITGEDVTDFLVSRDGSRFVALIQPRNGLGDRVVVSRIRHGERGAVQRATRAHEVVGSSVGLDAPDMAWQSPTSILLVNNLTRTVSELRSVAVDGAPAESIEAPTTDLLTDPVTSLVSSPAVGTGAYVVTRAGELITVSPAEEYGETVQPQARRISYVG